MPIIKLSFKTIFSKTILHDCHQKITVHKIRDSALNKFPTLAFSWLVLFWHFEIIILSLFCANVPIYFNVLLCSATFTEEYKMC